MRTVLVLEIDVPDQDAFDASVEALIRGYRESDLPVPVECYVAIREDADRVLSVFNTTVTPPADRSET